DGCSATAGPVVSAGPAEPAQPSVWPAVT
ncbi:hypothetical protein, partial [Mycobacterium tuberculosis]